MFGLPAWIPLRTSLLQRCLRSTGKARARLSVAYVSVRSSPFLVSLMAWALGGYDSFEKAREELLIYKIFKT